jgi:hypothetical protein
MPMRAREAAAILILSASSLFAAEPVDGPGDAERPSAAETLPELPSTVLPAEASPFLFTGKLSGADVHVIVKGAYSADLSAGIFFAGNPEADAFGAIGPVFSQSVDLTLEIPLGKGWALKTRFADDFAQNRYSLVYEREDPRAVLAGVSIGNADFPFDSKDALDVGASGAMSPGFGIRLGDHEGKDDRGFSARAILRYEATEKSKLTFRGKNKVNETAIPASGYIRGRFFSLPDRPIVQAYAYVRASTGTLYAADDGYSYAALDDYSISLARGTIDFIEAPAERLLLAYEPPPAAPDAVIQGRSAIALYEPGLDNPSEILSRYELPLGISIGEALDAGLYEREGGRVSSFALRIDVDGNYAELYGLGENDPYSLESRRPLLGIEPSLYVPGEPSSIPSGYEIRFSSLTPVENFALPEDFIKGSLRVRKNGADDGRWRYDEETNTVVFLDEVLAADAITIEFEENMDGWGSGDVVAAAFGEFRISKGFRGFAGFSLRQSLSLLSSDTADTPAPSSARIVAGVSGESDWIKGSIDLRLDYRNPDIDGSSAFDAAPGEEPVTEAYGSPWGRSSLPPGFDEESRAPLVYRDYRIADGWGNTALSAIDASPLLPEAGTVAHGPYPVADDEYETAMVAEFSLDAANWAGIQVELGEAYSLASYGITALTVPLRFIPDQDSGNPSIRIDAGALASGPDEHGEDRLEYPSRIASLTPPALSVEWTEIRLSLNAPASVLSFSPRLRIIATSGAAVSGRLVVGRIRAEGSPWELYAPSSPPFVSTFEDPLQGPVEAFPADFAGDSGTRFIRASFPQESSGRDASLKRSFDSLDAGGYRTTRLYLRATSLSLDPGSSIHIVLYAGGNAVRRYALGGGDLSAAWQRLGMNSADGGALLEGSGGETLALASETGSSALGIITAIGVEAEGVRGGSMDIAGIYLADPLRSLALSSSGALTIGRDAPILSAGSIPLIHKLRLALKEKTTFDSALVSEMSADAALGLWLFDLRGSTSILASADGTNEEAGVSRASHGVTFGAGPFALSTDYFQDSGGASSLDLSGNLAFKEAFSLKAGSNALRSDGSLSRSWSLGLKSKLKSESISADALFAAKENDASVILIEDYFDRWIQEFSSLGFLPLSATVSRSIAMKAVLDGERRGGNPSQDLSLKIGASHSGGVSPRALDSADLTVSPLIPLGKNATWRITPRYERSMRLEILREGAWFDADLASLAEAFAELPSFYAGIPIAEFWNDSFASEIAGLAGEPYAAALSAKIGVSVSREPFLTLWDIAVPAACGYSLKRKALREGSTTSDVYSHEISLSFTGADILGRRGRARLLPFIDADNFIFDHLLVMDLREGAVDMYLYSSTIDAYFEKNELDTLRFLNILSLGSENTLVAESATLKLSWGKDASARLAKARDGIFETLRKKPPEKNICTYIPGLLALEKGRISNVQELGISFIYGKKDTEEENYSGSFAYSFGFQIGKLLRLSAISGCKAVITVKESEISYDVRPSLGVGLKLEF